MLKTSQVPEEICADPLLYDAQLSLKRTFHPMGYAVEIRSNSADVLAAAEKLWSRYPVLSPAEPIRIRVIAGTTRSSSSRDPRPPRGEGHLFSIAHGVDDFALADLSAGFAFASLSVLTKSSTVSIPSGCAALTAATGSVLAVSITSSAPSDRA